MTLKKPIAIGITLAIAFSVQATAQTLSRFAPSGALLALEVNDLTGARKTAAAFVQQVEQLKLTDTLIEAMDLSARERRQAQSTLNDLGGLIEREGLVAVYLDPKNLEPRVLLAARPSTNSTARVNKWLQDSLNNTRKSGGKVVTSRAGGFPIYTMNNRDLDMPMSIGFQGGIAYASTDLNTLGGFLRRVGGGTEPGLAASANYRNAMDGAGSGTLRIYADLGGLAGVARLAAKEFGDDLRGVQLEPIFKMIATLGRLGAAWKLSADGLEQTSLFSPDRQGGDDQLYSLITATNNITLRAASLVPANATTFATGSGNATAWFDYVSTLVDRTKLNPGGLDPILRRELGLDFRKVALSWMSGEFATATFATKSTPNPSNAISALGDSVLYISTNDEAAARSSLEAILPRMVEQGNKLAEQKLLDYRPSRAKIAGVDVTRFPIAQGISFTTATRDGFMLLATSDDAMIAALGGGPRLADTAGFKAAMARVPANANGYSYTDLPRNLREGAEALSEQLQLGLAAGLDIKPSTAKKLSEGLQKLFAFTADRTGPQISWSVTGGNGVLSKSFTPVKW
jgi:hypothetical protein